ncbi:UNVERIFIED_CONTAM: hypothetical protein K2H54_000720, partial [Gekko kuhli]
MARLTPERTLANPHADVTSTVSGVVPPKELAALTPSLFPLLNKGGEHRMAQFFRGNLAGLMIRSGKLENKKVIDCLYTCKEGLELQVAEGTSRSLK